MTATPLPARVRQWRDRGTVIDISGHSIFTVDLGPRDRDPIVVIHGFPGSSFDWAQVATELAAEHRIVVFDLLGYGLSDKPRSASYSLFEQADLVEAVLRVLKIDHCVLVAHDMGDTVTAELLHRHNLGQLGFTPTHTILTNGSIFIDLAVLTSGQRLGARSRGVVVPFDLPDRVVRRAVAASFAAAAPPPPNALDDVVALITHNGGSRLLLRQTQYINERRRNQPRWTSALVDYPQPLTALWGVHDPIAVLAMAHRLKQLRPSTEVVEFDAGHWLSIEAPERLAAEIAAAIARVR